MVTVMLFGSASECENARKLIEEACDNKEQKAKQRAKEYEKKKDEKRRDRQLYHMRHTHDYEELELPLGASKVRLCHHWCLLCQQGTDSASLLVSCKLKMAGHKRCTLSLSICVLTHVHRVMLSHVAHCAPP